MDDINIFSEDFAKILKENAPTLQIENSNVLSILRESNSIDIPSANCSSESNSGRNTRDHSETPNHSKKELFCSSCRTEFKHALQQREHYKLDWHRYNVKQKLKNKDPISEEKYNEEIDDLSSTSGDSGTSSDEEETLNSIATAQGKIFLKSADDTVYSLYKCLLVQKKEELMNETIYKKLKDLNSSKQWTILMLGGGHFAGAVFKNNQPILHKTFHLYTVRAGQGGAQSAKDNTGGASKSAGSSLRRYNEAALAQRVGDIVEVWKDEIAKSSLILYRAAGPYNRAILFGGKVPLFERSDIRLRVIPFSTRRAKFTELQRVYGLLANVNVYSSLEIATKEVIKQNSPIREGKRNKARTMAINRAKSRETVEREIPGKLSENMESSDNDGPVEYTVEELEISFEGLEEYGDSLTPEQRKRGNKKRNNAKAVPVKVGDKQNTCQNKPVIEDNSVTDDNPITDEYPMARDNIINEDNTVTEDNAFTEDNPFTKDNLIIKEKKKKKPKKKKNQKLREEAEMRKKLLIEVLTSGVLEDVQRVLNHEISQKYESQNEPDEVSTETDKDKKDILAQILDEEYNTPLHIASANNHNELVQFLLEKGADPCLKNKKQQTPYTTTQNKETREVFKEFAFFHPDKHNYNKAQIPIPVPTSEEAAERKRIARKLKRDKDRQKKKETVVRKHEEAEQERFSNLSDREKCALAAERRILNQGGSVTSRCFFCGIDTAGKVTFNYMNYHFCTIYCLKAHRLKNI